MFFPFHVPISITEMAGEGIFRRPLGSLTRVKGRRQASSGSGGANSRRWRLKT
ncbi:hypothetical protein ES332_D03G104400v1 [Gossypium tomentosum]|uniref:Uncharacterized protein n=1 Tax=Gossypium tomentosum TaxID=34277 RepID=A0A5D2LL38_GOSTO|nr:hypothetical protein ES332_D03G104400v1 [Gossypium tomentosum]